jgi:hypothetical protein
MLFSPTPSAPSCGQAISPRRIRATKRATFEQE